MKKFKIGIIGIGRCATHHIEAINSLSNVFELVGMCDLNPEKYKMFPQLKLYNLADLLQQKPDCISLCLPSSLKFQISKQILKSGINLFSEKPFVLTINQFQELESLSESNGTFLQGAFHARFNSQTAYILQFLEYKKKSTEHKEFGKLLGLELYRFDPYIINRKVQRVPELTSGLDSWPNIFSELDRYVSSFKVLNVKFTNTSFAPEYLEVATEITGSFPGGKFSAYTDWNKELNEKMTTLEFERVSIVLDHTAQRILLKTGGNSKIIKDFSFIASRLEVEYFRMYQELFEVLCGTKRNNAKLTKELVKIVENCYGDNVINSFLKVV